MTCGPRPPRDPDGAEPGRLHARLCWRRQLVEIHSRLFPARHSLYTDDGGDILKGPRNVDAAKRLLADSGYAGEPVTLMAAQDVPHHKAWGDVTVDLLKRLASATIRAAMSVAPPAAKPCTSVIGETDKSARTRSKKWQEMPQSLRPPCTNVRRESSIVSPSQSAAAAE